MKRLALYLLLLAGQGTRAQYTTNYVALGDQAYANKDYYEAAHYYEKAAAGMHITNAGEVPYQGSLHRGKMKGDKTKPEDKAYLYYQLGQSHRLYENYTKAHPWYYKILNENFEAQYPDTRLWYGVCLRATNNYEEARRQLEQYLQVHQADDSLRMLARKEYANCVFAIQQYKYPVLAEVSALKGFNGDGSNYALIQKDGNYWFTSSRMNKDSEKRLNRIYAKKKGSSAPEQVVIKDEGKYKEVEYGTSSLHPMGNRMYLTRWYKHESRSVREILMLTKQDDNSWGNPVVLNSNVNMDGYNAMQPCITSDAKRLYFASDRPGGQGGYDIWIAELDAEGQPVNATNAGSQVNTLLDEQAPYFDLTEKRLVFSSKGHTGLGGFDLFEVRQSTGSWMAVTNMGTPINSPKDDMYYFPDESDDRKFYLSSDRESICCLEIFEVHDQRYIVKGVVIDCESQKALSQVKVSMQDADSRTTEREMVTSDSGMYYFPVSIDKPYNIVFEKENYFTKVVSLPDKGGVRNDTLISKAICIQPFTVGKPIVINDVLYDFNSAELRRDSKRVLDGLVRIMKDNPNIKVELASHTDSIGTEEYNLKLSQARAESCVSYIVSSGISADRIFAKGYGESKPVAPNSNPDGTDSPEGRQLNRRTEFTVLSVGIALN